MLEEHYGFLRQKLHSLIETVVGFTSLDGCVIFGQNLDMVSFGSKLKTATTEDLLPLQDEDVDKNGLDNAMKSLGTRNNSALMFCRSNPGAVAFVVSQDGDIRVYRSDQQAAYAFDRICPD